MTTFEISIHALREEGDAPSGRNTPDTPNFYPRPPRGGRLEGAVHGIKTKDFYPRPPRGGRRVSGLVGASPTYFYPPPPRGGRQLARRLQGVQQGFLSTPSARRATGDVDRVEATIDISIHALREEGDDLPCSRYLEIQDFYPRPPRGGRQGVQLGDYHTLKFLSTPSARRATQLSHHSPSMTANFYPRPPRGGRPTHKARHTHPDTISIHALREEGDCLDISTRRLRPISIHALREEGDSGAAWQQRNGCYFYPRPPRGGRLFCAARAASSRVFLSTPSARRATRAGEPFLLLPEISIHALREEGDTTTAATGTAATDFYPRPPRGGRLPLAGVVFTKNIISIHALREEGDQTRLINTPLNLLFLSTPSARRATGVAPV